MPQIIKVGGSKLPQQTTIGDGIEALGNAFTSKYPEALLETYRQKALSEQRKNAAIGAYSTGGGLGDAIRAEMDPAHVSKYERLRLVKEGAGAQDPRIDALGRAGGEGFGTTAEHAWMEDKQKRYATDKGLEGTKYAADSASTRNLEGKKFEAENTPVDTAEGFTTRKEIANRIDPNTGVAPMKPARSSDQVIAGAMDKALQQMPPGAGGQQTELNRQMPAWMAKKAGIEVAPMSVINPKTNEAGQSYDNGRTVELDDGRRVPMGGGFAPTGQETGISERRLAIQKQQAGQPSQHAGMNPLEGDYAQNAYRATGIAPAAASHLNTIAGATGMLKLFGVKGGELDPNIERGRQELAVTNRTIKGAFQNSPTHALSGKESGEIDHLLPTDRLFANDVTEMRKVEALYKELVADNQATRNLIATSADTATINAAQRSLVMNEKALRMITKGVQPEDIQPQQPGQQPAAQPDQKPTGGFRILSVE